MDLREAIRERRSIRAFRRAPLPDGALDALREAVLWAPSAGHLQSRRFHFVFRDSLRRRLGATAGEDRMFETAALVVVGFSDHRIQAHYGARGRDLYCIQDVAASIQNLLLAAHASGLGAVWVGAFDEARVRRIIEPPSYLRPVALVPVGIPAERPSPPPRLSVEEAIVEVA